MTSIDKSPIPLDGHDVWDTISLGKPSPRTEILHNIDLHGTVPPASDILGGYTGIALRVGEMKLLMNVPNDTWYKPPELGAKPEREIPLDAKLTFPDVVRRVLSISLLIQRRPIDLYQIEFPIKVASLFLNFKTTVGNPLRIRNL